MDRFTGRVAVITGAGNGIGRATAARLIDEGATVVGVDIDEAALGDAADALGERFEPFPADVADAAPEHDYVSYCIARHGSLDIAFLNAGVLGATGPIHDYSLEEFDRVMAINVRGVWLGTSRALGAMRERGAGVITITSSTGGLRGSGGLGPYVASKHAVVGIMKSAAIEGGPFGVRVNTIHPGPTNTQVWSAAEETKRIETGAERSGLPQLYRVADPSEVASVVAFLSSDEAGFCTGGSFPVDGGLLAGPPYSA
ncbi:SDR family NAD(P)-dependent oxidoreductase [Microbacterium sp. Root61]|uniref:SDR family NAD(P)-dependent oxidoreductase n=1 Tax=Microbacterium sp. Root61 TaxID=1736570 RepID=UPI00138EEF01|nr:SDR family oxidoreductase [Microbacterium sp. Root61]